MYLVYLLNCSFYFRRTPLHYAATMVQYQCAVSLTVAGSKVNVVDTKGCSPLHYAAACDAEAKWVQVHAETN